MKKFFAVLSILSIGIASLSAGCPPTHTTADLTKFDAKKNSIMLGELVLKLKPGTVIKGTDGKKVELKSLIGKKVKVAHSHKKVDSVTAVKAES